MRVKVFRMDPSVDKEGYFQEYDVPVNKEEKWTVMDVLHYIALNLDSSLSYYRHSICNQGICARCLIKVNGKVELACVYKVVEDELILEPGSGKLVKDLVTKVDVPHA
jgi:succinate dehydrogenase / fumarate reductase iron-sulfur subunit